MEERWINAAQARTVMGVCDHTLYLLRRDGTGPTWRQRKVGPGVRYEYLEHEVNEWAAAYPPAEWISAALAGRILGVAQNTLSKWRQNGHGPTFREVPKGTRHTVEYSARSVREWARGGG